MLKLVDFFGNYTKIGIEPREQAPNISNNVNREDY